MDEQKDDLVESKSSSEETLFSIFDLSQKQIEMSFELDKQQQASELSNSS